MEHESGCGIKEAVTAVSTVEMSGCGVLIRDFLIVSVPLSEVGPQANSNSGVRSRPRHVHQPFDS